MKSQVIQLLAPQLFIGASSATLFAWSRNEGSPVLPRQTETANEHIQARVAAPEPTSPPVPLKAPRKDTRLLKRDTSICGYKNGNKGKQSLYLLFAKSDLSYQATWLTMIRSSSRLRSRLLLLH